MSRYIGVDTTPRRVDIAPELRRTLEANGMQARIARKEDGTYKLIAYCHDSKTPFFYDLDNKQLSALVNGGTNTQNKEAYRTFVSLVKNDFYVPGSWVAAKNVNSPVNMGLHGYRVRPGEYGIGAHRGFRGFFGPHFGRFDGSFWPYPDYAPTRLRRIGGQLFYDDRNPVVAERPDGKLRPGELKSGSYGFYTKSRQQVESQKKDVVLQPKGLEMTDAEKKNVQTLRSITWYDAKQGLATGKTFNDMLETHGIVLDKEHKTLTIKVKGSIKNYLYDISDADAKVLFNDKIKLSTQKGKKIVTYNEKDGNSVDERLACLNKILAEDYKDKITPEKLNVQDYISLTRKDGEQQVRQVVNEAAQYAQANDIIDMTDAREDYRTGFVDSWNSIGVVDGQTLDKELGFYLPNHGGRALSVGEIQAYPSNDGTDRGLTYKMSAVINNKVYVHDISQKDYIKFLNFDDKRRLELFDKTFKEVSIKSASNGNLQDNVHSDRIEGTPTAAKVNGQFSFLVNGEVSTITSAMAFKDEVSGDYILNVRDGKDAGKWSFKITEAQYLAFKSSSDNEKAKMLETLIPWSKENKGKVKVVSDQELQALGKGHGLFNGSVRPELSPKVLSGLKEQGLGYEAITKKEVRAESKPSEVSAKDTEKSSVSRKGFLREVNENLNLDELRAQTKKNLAGDAGVNGESLRNLKENKMWVRSGEHGRETSIGDITVEKLRDANGRTIEGKFRMSAVIDGNVISHEISQKEYNKFLSVNDMQRMKLFDKIFTEVKMKTVPGEGFNFGAAILAALTVGVGVAAVASRHRDDHPRPEIYAAGYYKPGVVSPAASAQALYEDKVQNAMDNGLAHGRGL